MSELEKNKLLILWEMRKLTANEALDKISKNKDLKFLLTTAGIWFLLRLSIGIWIGVHVIYFLYRIFNVVLG